jgi:hypothetical protein
MPTTIQNGTPWNQHGPQQIRDQNYVSIYKNCKLRNIFIIIFFLVREILSLSIQ